MKYDIFFTLLFNGKTYKVFQLLTEAEVLEIMSLQGILMDGIRTNMLVRGEFKSGNSQLNGKLGFWDIERVN